MNPAKPLPTAGQSSLLTRAIPCQTKPLAPWVPAPFRVVLPFHLGDADRALRLCHWLADLNNHREYHPYENEALLLTDDNIPAEITDPILRVFLQTFPNAQLATIAPLKTAAPWPAGNNHAFFRLAKLLATDPDPRPILWLETDVAPCKPYWLDILETEYNLAQKPFMGYWVECYDIMNGMGIYPPDIPKWLPRLFSQPPDKQGPWDCVMAPEMVHHFHPCNHMMPNIWLTRKNDRPGIIKGIEPNWTNDLLDWVLTHNAVLLHRCKTGQLIHLLRQKLNIPSAS